jgi:hypothetical protein
MDNIKKRLEDLCDSLEYYKLKPKEKFTSSFHNLITGAPGTGKTKVAMSIAGVYKEAGLRGAGVVNTKLVQAMAEYDGRFGLILAGYEDEIDLLLNENAGWLRRFKNNRFALQSYTGNEFADVFMIAARQKLFTLDDDLHNMLVGFCSSWVKDHVGDRQWGNAGEIEGLLEYMIAGFQIRNSKTANPEKILTPEYIPPHLRRYI